MAPPTPLSTSCGSLDYFLSSRHSVLSVMIYSHNAPMSLIPKAIFKLFHFIRKWKLLMLENRKAYQGRDEADEYELFGNQL